MEEQQLPIVRDIRSWVGLPEVEYSKNVDILVERLQDIDAQAETSMTETLLTDNITEHFANGIYAREMDAPAGVAIISRIHMEAGISVLASGTMDVMDRHGFKRVTAPHTFTSEAGVQRIGFTVTPCNWVSIFKADKQEGDMLEVVTAETLEEYHRRKQ